ncbi:MAG: tRNA (guanine(10)-N(2))-dimethyltransferase [Candidatus Nezhaarchaeales archaeon]
MSGELVSGVPSLGYPVKQVFEGDIVLLVPDGEVLGRQRADSIAFYNPAMELCRDIAVSCLQVYQRTLNQGLIIAEPLTATGVRGLRYAKEVKGVEKVVIGDVNPEAVKLAKVNVAINALSDKVIVEQADANLLLSVYVARKTRFNAVDIDPFGSPAPYISAALRSLRDGGLIAVTATDMPPLCGVHPMVAERRYGGTSLRSDFCHEVAVRLLLSAICREAGKQDLGIEPLLCHFTRHYVRIYSRIRVGAVKADASFRSLGYAVYCPKCGFRSLISGGIGIDVPNRCKNCGNKLQRAGPLWAGRIQDKDFCTNVLREVEARSFKLKNLELRLLKLLQAEAEGPPLYYVLDRICHLAKVAEPSLEAVISKLRSNGFKATRTHFNLKGVKTDAPITRLISIVKELRRS